MHARKHPLGKGEVVSSILTGSTSHAPICALSCSRLPSPHKRSDARTWGKSGDFSSADTLDCPATAR